MITPRRTRLIRAVDLRGFRQAIRHLAATADNNPAGGPGQSSRFIVVPTRSAARQLGTATAVTRDELYQVLESRLSAAQRMLSLVERENIMYAAAATKAAGLPFQLRPGLVAEMVRFYDQLKRQSQSVQRFEELLREALGRDAEVDRGAERMLRQTTFLAESFREYERRVAASDGVDEHAARVRLTAEPLLPPVLHVVVTLADWIAEPDGLFVADFDLLSRMPGLEAIDLVCTEAVLASGFHERLHNWWPGLDEVAASDIAPLEDAPRPLLSVPGVQTSAQTAGPQSETDQLANQPASQPWFVHRDREEELVAIARRLVGNTVPTAPLERVAVVFKRPLPYLYLAPDTLGAAGLAFQATDALPLAAEPAASAVDLLLECIEGSFTRSALVALLGSPHYTLASVGASRNSSQGSSHETSHDSSHDSSHRIATASVRALDRFMSEARYLGGLDRLESLAIDCASAAFPAYDRALALARALEPLLSPQRASVQLRHLLEFMDTHASAAPESAPDRNARAHQATRNVLASLADAHAAHYDPIWSIGDLAAAVRRGIGERTFEAEPARAGVQLLDDRAARYGEFDAITLVGIVENEWPERPARNIFYPSSLLNALGWPTERDRRAAADARFVDLLGSPARSIVLSTFTVEDESLVSRSTQLDEVPRARLAIVEDRTSGAGKDAAAAAPMFADEYLADGDLQLDWIDEQIDERIDERAREWAAMRLRRSPADAAGFHGATGPVAARAWSVSALETYIDCPFKFFARHVLRLQEDPDDEEIADPRRQGQFVHEVFEVFFREWQEAGHKAITPDNLDRARAALTVVVERLVSTLGDAEAALERTRLLGSSAAAGLGEAVLRMEAERPIAVVERLLEERLDGTVEVTMETGTRAVHVRGKADRIDLLADGTFRLIDYKLGWPPNKARALQLPIYALRAASRLTESRKRTRWTASEAVYLAFKGPKRVVPLFTSPGERDEVLEAAGRRLVDAVDAIERGEFPPSPEDVFQCERCSFAAVCRKDYVGDV